MGLVWSTISSLVTSLRICGRTVSCTTGRQPVDSTVIVNNSYHSSSGIVCGTLALIPDEHTNTQLRDNARACIDAQVSISRTAASASGADGTEAVERCTDGRWLPVGETDCDEQVTTEMLGRMSMI